MPHDEQETINWGAIRSLLKVYVQWVVANRLESVGLITYKRLRELIEEAQRGPKSPAGREIGPILALSPIQPILGHYGAVEGLDLWRECDGLCTIGDPRMDPEEAWYMAGYCGIPECEREQWAEKKARAELEQAHGRLRTARRAKTAFALHIGELLPSGAAWLTHRYQQLPAGDVSVAASATPELIRHRRQGLGLTLEQMAVAVGCSVSALRNYESGRRVIPLEIWNHMTSL